MSLCTLVIGQKGQGKSTFVKSMIEGKPNFIFDVQNEYSDFNPAPDLDRKKFIETAAGFTDTYIVFEEATGFFRGALSSDVDRLLLGARHTRNRYIFCFHYIRAVPPQIFHMMNYVVLFKTTDDPKFVQKKYPELAVPCLQLKSKPDYSKTIVQII